MSPRTGVGGGRPERIDVRAFRYRTRFARPDSRTRRGGLDSELLGSVKRSRTPPPTGRSLDEAQWADNPDGIESCRVRLLSRSRLRVKALISRPERLSA